MKFGTLQFFGWPERRTPIAEVFHRAIERIEVMDKTGYDAVWLAEHHFTGYSVCPTPHVMAAHVASRTRRLRIGTGVSLAAFYHPLRLAEEIALLDILSNGRVNWGAGRGFDPTEFRAFGVNVEESGKRFHEAVEIVHAAWQNERLTYHGEYWHFDNVEVLPKPQQSPYPPTWLAAGSEGAIKWAGKRGYSIMLGPHATFAENQQHLQLYQQELSRHGFSCDGREVPIARFIAVAATDAEAEEVARSGTQFLTKTYMNAGKATRPESQAQSVLVMDERKKIERYIDSVVIHGTPEKVIDKLQQLEAEGQLHYLMCAPLSHSSFSLFTERVLPKFL
jgi:luciferase family oxidoreductase group 1